MVAELPGFGLAPGEEDRGNESEPELETSKMVQVGCCFDDCEKINYIENELKTISCVMSEGGEPEKEKVRRVPVDGFVPRSMARSDQEGLQGADTNPEENGATDHGREGRGGDGKDRIGQNCRLPASSLGETQSSKINRSKSSRPLTNS